MNERATGESVEGIAVIGMAGRFPGARNIQELWYNLSCGKESISFFSELELAESGVAPDLIKRPDYVKARGLLGDTGYFDAAFFGYNPKVAALMDPQHRLFLESSWEALEHAGYDSTRYPGRIGVFAGQSMNSYLLTNVYPHIDFVASVDGLQAAIGNDKDSLTTEVSYKLNLKGPAVTVQTSSSTSLAAVHYACLSLLTCECDMALAGGVSVHFPEKAGYVHQEGGPTSSDGHCRAFDADAGGLVNGHGVGVVVLKRFEDAVADGDSIYAVIRGSAVNNDGASKVSYNAPSVEGQAEVIQLAQAIAGVGAETISYVETHGTGTALGDPIEIAALTQAFRGFTPKKQFCAIGSVKTNLGHLDAAAGIAGLIKTVLALKRKQIPASLNFKAPNPRIDFENSPFFVNTTLREWNVSGFPRRAGVSSFGMGGTNVHVVVEEAPKESLSGDNRSCHPILLSAKTSSALETMTDNLINHLKQQGGNRLADIAYTLQVGRRTFNHRLMLVCATAEEAIEALGAPNRPQVVTAFQEPRVRPVAFMFPGQGTQYVHMTAGAYRLEPAFREAVDRCAELLKPHLNCDVRDILYPGAQNEAEAQQKINRTEFTQAVLFVVEYALSRLWMSWGVEPQAMIGHSIGEYVAACLAGTFSLEDALALVAARGRLMQGLPNGAMMAIALPEAEARSLTNACVSLAAINGKSSCVLSGPCSAIGLVEQQMIRAGMPYHRLNTQHAFHSAMMEPILGIFLDTVQRVKLSPPKIPFLSGVSGTWISVEEAADPNYWVRQLRQAVRFADGLGRLLEEPNRVLLEVGPGRTLCGLAKRQISEANSQVAIRSVAGPNDEQSDDRSLADALGRLWMAGVEPDWRGFHGENRRNRIELPTYPFERTLHWMGAPPKHKFSLRKTGDPADWFYLPSWKRTLAPSVVRGAGLSPNVWLAFHQPGAFTAALIERMRQAGEDVIIVTPASEFRKLGSGSYTVHPERPDHFAALFSDLLVLGKTVSRVVHLGGLVTVDQPLSATERFERYQELGLYPLISTVRALETQGLTKDVQIAVVSTDVHDVIGSEDCRPEAATILGACRVIPQEYPHLSCRNVDIVLQNAGSSKEQELLDQLFAELVSGANDAVVCYRGPHRWVQKFDHVRLDGDPGRSDCFREGGVYLVLGGLGNIGFTLAEHLARTYRAKLVLTGLTEVAPRSEWERLASDDSLDRVGRWRQPDPTGQTSEGRSHRNDFAENQMARKIHQLRLIESVGGEVLAVKADVANLSEMKRLIAQAHDWFGRIDGVIHAAGYIKKEHFTTIKKDDRAGCESHFRSKVHGLQVLEEALEGTDLDFCLVISSLASVLGGIGYYTYCAASMFADVFVRQHNRTRATGWLCLNSDGWRRKDGEVKSGTAQAFAMTPEEGVEIVRLALGAANSTQLIVSTGDLQARIGQWISMEGLDEWPLKAVNTSSISVERRNEPAPVVRTMSELESAIAEIWRTILATDKVGPDDNFFDVGGDSLTGIQLIGHLKKELGAQVSTVDLYERPTISELTKLILGGQAESEPASRSFSRGMERRERARRHRQIS